MFLDKNRKLALFFWLETLLSLYLKPGWITILPSVKLIETNYPNPISPHETRGAQENRNPKVIYGSWNGNTERLVKTMWKVITGVVAKKRDEYEKIVDLNFNADE